MISLPKLWVKVDGGVCDVQSLGYYFINKPMCAKENEKQSWINCFENANQ